MGFQVFKAGGADAALLALMNKKLIEDEGHRNNRLTVPELADRMKHWLGGDYQAVYAKDDGGVVGYALFREEPDHVYLRQFFVERDRRRKGYGKQLLAWLAENACKGKRVRVDVLVGNSEGFAFWKATGFKDYCVTMEK